MFYNDLKLVNNVCILFISTKICGYIYILFIYSTFYFIRRLNEWRVKTQSNLRAIGMIACGHGHAYRRRILSWWTFTSYADRRISAMMDRWILPWWSDGITKVIGFTSTYAYGALFWCISFMHDLHPWSPIALTFFGTDFGFFDF